MYLLGQKEKQIADHVYVAVLFIFFPRLFFSQENLQRQKGNPLPMIKG